eukprot:351760-Chlamydomonas_euryale.AAC.3
MQTNACIRVYVHACIQACMHARRAGQGMPLQPLRDHLSRVRDVLERDHSKGWTDAVGDPRFPIVKPCRRLSWADVPHYAESLQYDPRPGEAAQALRAVERLQLREPLLLRPVALHRE